MKILRLSPYYAPERISSTHLTEDLEAAYAERGYITEIFVPTPTRGITQEEWEKYRKIKYEEKRDGKLIVHRFAMFREGKNPIFRALRYVLVNVLQYFKGIRAKDVDAILGGSTPPTQGVLCAMVAQQLRKKTKKDIPFIFNLQDMFPESLVTTGLAKKNSLLYKIGDKISNYIYKNATHIMVISTNMKESLIKKGVAEEKISVIYNWIDTEATCPISREENLLFDEFGLNRGKFYLTYAGNLGHSQNVNILIDCAEKLKEYKDICFVIFGSGSGKEKLQKQIEDSGLTNIQLLPLQPMEKVSQVYSLGDASFVICKKGVGEGAFPSKAVSIMATGTPIIASFDLDSDLCRILEEESAGICADAENVDGAVQAILKLYENRQLVEAMGENARKLACRRFSKEAGTAERIAVLEQYLNNCDDRKG